MDQASPEGVVAPVETAIPPAAAPDGAQPEAVKPAAETPAAKPEGEEPKGVAKRIKELTDRIRAAEQRESRYLSLLEQQRQQPAQQPRTQVSDEEPLKGLKDFNYDEKAFLDYSERRATARADKAAKEVAKRYQVEQEAIGRRAKFDERVSAYADTVDDYHEVVTDRTPVSEAMADAIMDSDEAGALMYYLGNNPDVATKLYHLSPAKAGREIQKIEDRLVAERKKAAEKPVSQAPPPAPVIDASTPGNRIKSTDPEAQALSGNEWLKLREKELAAARKRKA